MKIDIQNTPKSTIVLSLIAIMLSIWAAYVVWEGTAGQNHSISNANFTVSDTVGIDRITIKHANRTPIELIKKQYQWTVNQQHPLDIGIHAQLMAFLTQAAVKRPMFEEDREYIQENAIENTIELTLYQFGKETLPLKLIENPIEPQTMYVKSPYMDEPMVAYLPGFEKEFSHLFSAQPLDYKNKVIFQYQTSDITQLEVKFYQEPIHSFTIHQENGRFKVKEVQEADSLRLHSYLQLFEHGDVKKWHADESGKIKDSLQAIAPAFGMFISTLHRKKGIQIYYQTGQKTPVIGFVTPDSLYATINTKVFEYLLQKKDFFIKQ